MTNDEAIKVLNRNNPVIDPRPCGQELSEAVNKAIEALEKRLPKRVNGKGKVEFAPVNWQGNRDTRYFCPTCNKPVKREDAYCHRCGQNLLFPIIRWSEYVKGEVQNHWVEWEEEDNEQV